MTVGFVMLAHGDLTRAAQVARHWASRDCPVVIHVDRRTKRRNYDAMRRDLAGLDNVRFAPRYACEWGTWGLVAATQDAATIMLREFAQVRHVFLASGSCIPLRPIEELRAYLDARPHTNFIESVTTADVGWTVGGLDIERFTLRFPFSWRKQRRAFDFYVKLQRALRFRRRVPAGLVPHLGSQWWCLTRQTLTAILQNPERPMIDAYFRRVWIPDESYFQTLVRQVSGNVESRSLTLAKFDFQGKPHVFYDDHMALLRKSDCFVARKIWPHAGKLFDTFLTDNPAPEIGGEPSAAKIDRLFAKAVERRTKGRSGLYMQSRHPNHDWENGVTAAPYSVFAGFSDVFVNFESWLAKATGTRVHGHLYAPDRAHFAHGETSFMGNLSDSSAARDYRPMHFLTNLIWNTRGERQCFQFGPSDAQTITSFIARDPNAQISMITGAWAIPMFQSNRDFADIRREAAILQKIETDFAYLLRLPWVKARVRVWNLAEFIENPIEPLQSIVDEISPRAMRRLTEAPILADLSGFGQFLQALRNQGMQPTLVGDFPVTDGARAGGKNRARPYLVQ
ncbi:MAG: beta-1,6-N-acetylglucosaminyltransferase [Cypionkella sp.]|nr:beta-1,6-N-acetylglucosaminyltransferase [Cypionkella sp.]